MQNINKCYDFVYFHITTLEVIVLITINIHFWEYFHQKILKEPL